jgi:hypothetical protein
VRLVVLALAVAGLVTACNSSKTSPPAPKPAPAATAPAAPAAPGEPRKLYGQPLAPAEPITVSALLAKPDAHVKQAVTVEGSVRKACTRKGCWMELAETTKDGTPGCRVTFKNYGFFVPTDSAGARARVQGVVEVDTLSASAVRHYEEEGAVFAAKQPDGTAREVRLVATGVELWRGP